MKIGLYGGSFNPVHNGHESVVKSVLEKKLVEEVWLLPCKDHPFNKHLAPIDDRINMLNFVFEEYDKVRIDYTEIRLIGKSYTSNTLRALRKQYSHDFFFIAGTDALNTIEQWKDFEYLKNTIKFIECNRTGYELRTAKSHIQNSINIENNLSSTAIRKRIQEKKSLEGMMHKKVINYIIEKELYHSQEFQNPSATVDIIVPYNEGIVLIKRKNDPFKDYWALPGGYLDFGRETLEQAAVRELEEETNLVAKIENLKLVGVYSEPNRDPRSHVISHVYEAQEFEGVLQAKDDAKEIKVFKKIPRELAFDHKKILNDFFKRKYVGEIYAT